MPIYGAVGQCQCIASACPYRSGNWLTLQPFFVREDDVTRGRPRPQCKCTLLMTGCAPSQGVGNEFTLASFALMSAAVTMPAFVGSEAAAAGSFGAPAAGGAGKENATLSPRLPHSRETATSVIGRAVMLECVLSVHISTQASLVGAHAFAPIVCTGQSQSPP